MIDFFNFDTSVDWIPNAIESCEKLADEYSKILEDAVRSDALPSAKLGWEIEVLRQRQQQAMLQERLDRACKIHRALFERDGVRELILLLGMGRTFEQIRIEIHTFTPGENNRIQTIVKKTRDGALYEFRELGQYHLRTGWRQAE